MPLRNSVSGKLTHIVDTVHGGAATGEGQPLHVPPLGAPEAQDSLLGEGVQREGVHALLVDHNKALVRPVAHLYNSTSLTQHKKYPRYSSTAMDPDSLNPDPDPIRIQGMVLMTNKNTAENFIIIFYIKNCNLLMSKLQEKPSALKREHLALKK